MKNNFSASIIILIVVCFFVGVSGFAQQKKTSDQKQYNSKITKGIISIILVGKCGRETSCADIYLHIYNDRKELIEKGVVECYIDTTLDQFGNAVKREESDCGLRFTMDIPQTGNYSFIVKNMGDDYVYYTIVVTRPVPAGKQEGIVFYDSSVIFTNNDAFLEARQSTSIKVENFSLTPSNSNDKNSTQPKSNCKGFSGIWDSKDFDRITITVNGNKAVGKFNLYGRPGTISGTLTNKVLKGTYRSPDYFGKQDDTGEFEFTLDDDGWSGYFIASSGDKIGSYGTCVNNK